MNCGDCVAVFPHMATTYDKIERLTEGLKSAGVAKPEAAVLNTNLATIGVLGVLMALLRFFG